MSEERSNEIARRDEMLELLYWFEGEGLTASATIPDMTRFLSRPEAEVRETLESLLQRRLVIAHPGAGSEYRLTETGRVEAARRFADEFASMLSQGHGECNDPTCDCHANPEAAAECHARRAGTPHAH